MVKSIERSILILDLDPRRAAKYLIKYHVITYLPLIQTIFLIYHNVEESKNSILYTWVTYMRRSLQNYTWVVNFYKTLQEVYKNKISPNESYYYNPKILFDDSYLTIPKDLKSKRHEICVTPAKMDRYKGNIKKYREFKDKQIVNDRLYYIVNNYPENLFPNGEMPYWYSKMKNTFEYHNPIDNMEVKLIRDYKGDYRYYCKVGASDIWDEIKNVPSEMRFIVNTLMYTYEDTNKEFVDKRFKNTVKKFNELLESNKLSEGK